MKDRANREGVSKQEQEALVWFVRSRNELTSREQADFAHWLAANPANQATFAEMEALWARAETPSTRLAAEEAPTLQRLLDRMDAPPERRTFGFRAAWATACLCLVLLAGVVWLERPHLLQDLLTADAVTARGEQRLVPLPDGSSALLDADSAIAIDYEQGERRLTLLRGAAFFSVIPTGGQFVVAAAGGEVQVLGTTFEVRLAGEEATVTVSEGKVNVQPPGHPVATLGHGQRLRYGSEGVSELQAADLAAAFAWQQGRLVFYRARLSEVMETVGRYRPGRIVILNDQVAERRITGSFPAKDPDAALDSLQTIIGFRRDTIASRLVIIH
jgi:transmembrane sensor